MAEKKQDVDPVVQAHIDSVYCPKIQAESPEAFIEKLFPLYNFTKNVDWISSSYHLERATLIQKKGVKEAKEYFGEIIKMYGCCGIAQQITKVESKGMKGTQQSTNFYVFGNAN